MTAMVGVIGGIAATMPVTARRAGGERGLLAVCGSHRIAAIKDVYNEDADLEVLTDAHYLIVLDYADIYDDADEATQALLDRLSRTFPHGKPHSTSPSPSSPGRDQTCPRNHSRSSSAPDPAAHRRRH